MHGFQAVPHVGKGAADDNGHSIVEIARLHLIDDADGADVRRFSGDVVVAAQAFSLTKVMSGVGRTGVAMANREHQQKGFPLVLPDCDRTVSRMEAAPD
jgi:hypothetical protein